MHEARYRDLFAQQYGGRTEVRVPFGRIDVLTEHHAVEVEHFATWREGVRQALAYGAQVSQRPAIALYGAPEGDYRAVAHAVRGVVTLFMLDGTRWVHDIRTAVVGPPATPRDILAELGVAREPAPRQRGIRLTEAQTWAAQCKGVAALNHAKCRGGLLDDCPDFESHWRPGWGVEPWKGDLPPIDVRVVIPT